MPDSSAIPVRRVYEARPAKVKTKSMDPIHPRWLLSARRGRASSFVHLSRRTGKPLSRCRFPAFLHAPPTHHRWDSAAPESSHAEAFYFQKQIHSQTLMIFVLEDGEQIEGNIEWYDRNAIKVRQGEPNAYL